MLLWILSASLLVLDTGCGVLFTITRPGEEQVVGNRLSGDVCAEVEKKKEIDRAGRGRRDGRMIDVGGKTFGYGSPIDAPDAEQVLGVACVDYSGHATAARLYRLDPLEPEPFEVAVMLAECGRSIDCLGEVLPQQPGDHDKYIAGLLSWYSANLDRATAEARVTASGASPQAAKVFLDQLDTTRQDIEAIVRELEGGEKAVYLDIPYETAEARVREYAQHAEALGALEPVAAAAAEQRSAGVSDETIASLEDLRRKHVASCGGFTCMRDPVGSAIAKELFLSHISRVDVPAAVAELPYLPKGKHMDRVAELQDELMRKHKNAFDVVQRGMDSGLDKDTAASAAGGVEPLAFAKAYTFDFSKLDEPWDHMLPPPRSGKLVEYTYRVKKKTVSGDTTTLHFYDEVRTWKQETCQDTDRVDRIDGGRVYYKQRCKLTGKTESMRTKREPVVVPTSEAKAVKAKEWVSYVGLTGETWTGRITRVKQAEDAKEAVQLRGIRLK